MSIWRRIRNLWTLSGLEDLQYLESDVRHRASRKNQATIVEDSPLDKIDLS